MRQACAQDRPVKVDSEHLELPSAKEPLSHSSLIVNTPSDVWVWVKWGSTAIPLDIAGWVLCVGKEFEFGPGSLVFGRGTEDEDGVWCPNDTL